MSFLTDKIRVTVFAAILGILALILGIWFLVLSPRFEESAQLTVQQQDLELANLSLLTRQREFLELAANIPTAAADAQTLFSQMPQTAELPNVLRQLTNAATSADISASNIQVINTSIPQSVPPAKTADGSEQSVTGINLATMALDMTLTGEPDQLLSFLDNLQSLDRSVLVTGTNLMDSLDEGKSTQTLPLTASMFVLESALPDLVANANEVIANATSILSQ